MNRLTALLLACLVTTGCATPQRVPPATFGVTVVDEETDAPIANAQVRAVYQSPTSGWTSPTPSLTDDAGRATLLVPEVVIEFGFAEAYAGGGVFRGIRAEADGYTPASISEGPHFGLFERSPPTLGLRPIRNRYGAVRILAAEAKPGGALVYHSDKPLPISLTTLEVLDGPNAGERLTVPIVSFRPTEDYPVGSKFYLQQPVDKIRKSLASGIDLFASHEVMRKATREELYAPPVEDARGSRQP